MRELVFRREVCCHGRAQANTDFDPLLQLQPQAWPQTLLVIARGMRCDSLRPQMWLLAQAALKSPGRQRYVVAHQRASARATQTVSFDFAAHVCPSAATSYIERLTSNIKACLQRTG